MKSITLRGLPHPVSNEVFDRIAELEAWIRNACPLIQAVGLDPIPHRRSEALKLWESVPIDPSKH